MSEAALPIHSQDVLILMLARRETANQARILKKEGEREREELHEAVI